MKGREKNLPTRLLLKFLLVPAEKRLHFLLIHSLVCMNNTPNEKGGLGKKLMNQRQIWKDIKMFRLRLRGLACTMLFVMKWGGIEFSEYRQPKNLVVCILQQHRLQ